MKVQVRHVCSVGAMIAAIAVTAAGTAATEPIDRVDVTTAGKNMIGPMLYKGYGAAPTDLTVFWQSFAAGNPLNSTLCNTLASIATKGGTTVAQRQIAGCSNAKPGWPTRVPTEGSYVVTVTVTPATGAPFTTRRDLKVGA